MNFGITELLQTIKNLFKTKTHIIRFVLIYAFLFYVNFFILTPPSSRGASISLFLIFSSLSLGLLKFQGKFLSARRDTQHRTAPVAAVVAATAVEEAEHAGIRVRAEEAPAREERTARAREVRVVVAPTRCL